VAVFTRLDGQPVDPDAGDLDLTAGWGHAGKGGVTMPGRGKVLPGTAGILPALPGNAGVPPAQSGQDARGPREAYDIYLNDRTCWRNVPAPVWEYTIGGYQVIKKWLSYRERALLGRGLTLDEVRYVTELARRLAALVALQPDLDANYRATVARTCQPG